MTTETTNLPALRASTAGRLTSGTAARNTIVSVLAECRAVLGSPEATNPANAAQVGAFRSRLEVLESVVAEEVSADWFCLSAIKVMRDADDVIGALMGSERDAAPILNTFKASVREIASYRNFTV